MGIEQHAEAAVQKLAVNCCWDAESDLSDVVAIVGTAITEAAAEQAATIAKQAARIAELEALGPLIFEFGQAKWSQGYESPTDEKGDSDGWVDGLKRQIDAILKGGD